MGSMIKYNRRSTGEYITVGLDANGRIIELVYEYDVLTDLFFVYHALVPPTKKTLTELKMN